MKPMIKIERLAKSLQADINSLVNIIESMPKAVITVKAPKAVKAEKAVPAAKAIQMVLHPVAAKAVKAQVKADAKKDTNILGLKGLPNGTKMHTTVRMGSRASGESRSVSAIVKNGMLYIDGRTRGFTNLTKARRAAEAVAGRAATSMKYSSGTQSWRVTRTGQTVEQFRKAPGAPRLVQAELPL